MSNITDKPFVVIGPGGIEINSYPTIEEAYEELQRILSGDPEVTPEVLETYFEVTLQKKERKVPRKAVEVTEPALPEEIPPTFPWG